MCRDELLLKQAAVGLIKLDSTPDGIAPLLTCFEGASRRVAGAHTHTHTPGRPLCSLFLPTAGSHSQLPPVARLSALS
jgi:hypothetical protein